MSLLDEQNGEETITPNTNGLRREIEDNDSLKLILEELKQIKTILLLILGEENVN